jgi:hypothetical protein
VIEVAEAFRRFADGYLSAHEAGKGGAIAGAACFTQLSISDSGNTAQK